MRLSPRYPSRCNALQARVAQDRDRTNGHHSEGLHLHREGIDLHLIDLVAGEDAAQRVDADILRLKVTSSVAQLAIKVGHFDFAALATSSTERRVLAKEARNMQAAGDQLIERHAVMTGDVGEADMDLSTSSSASM